MNHSCRIAVAASLFAFASAHAGELKKDYFGATKPGDWISQELSSPDGSRSTYNYKRLPDEDGHTVLEMYVKVIAGPGAGAESKNTMVLPKDFNLARDLLSYGMFTERMSMAFGSTVMSVDPTTLNAIRKGSKDYRGAVTFEATETIDGHACDRYAYSLSSPKETGKLWLDDTVPFGIVRQSANVLNEDGSLLSTYVINLTGTGREQVETAASAPEPEKPAAPAVVTLLEGYNAGRVALDVAVLAGSSGRKLGMTLRNKTDDEITVKLAPGNVDIPGSSPVSELQVTVAKAADIVIGPGESSDPIPVAQRGTRGPIEGTFTLSTYEGTPLYSGTVTVGQLPK